MPPTQCTLKLDFLVDCFFKMLTFEKSSQSFSSAGLASQSPCFSALLVSCCSVLQCVAVRGSVLQCVAVPLNSHASRHYWSLVAVCCSVLQYVAVCGSVLQ